MAGIIQAQIDFTIFGDQPPVTGTLRRIRIFKLYDNTLVRK